MKRYTPLLIALVLVSTAVASTILGFTLASFREQVLMGYNTNEVTLATFLQHGDTGAGITKLTGRVYAYKLALDWCDEAEATPESIQARARERAIYYAAVSDAFNQIGTMGPIQLPTDTAESSIPLSLSDPQYQTHRQQLRALQR